ncbi:MAG: hypothetical protein E8D41_09520 [Nitrospira sp.]|nr:MAG: hypothetical protein E8D41_09520 [Nitrospira sp.]
MNTKTGIMCATLSVFVIGLTTAAWAVDMDAMKKKAETVKGQAAAVKKEGGEATQSAKDMKAQDAMKNAGEMKAEGMKLKNAATGK